MKTENNNKFQDIKTIIKKYSELSIDDKLNFLKQLCQNIIYNEDYQIYIIQENFISNLLLDISKQDNSSKKLTYVRIFFMLFHNVVTIESKYQFVIFKQIFEERIQLFKDVMNLYIQDLKIQKFILGTIYKIFILNTNILENNLNSSHIEISTMNR